MTRRHRPTAPEVAVAPARPGAVGVCGRCGSWVLPKYLDARGLHTALLIYGARRRTCGGEVIPLWPGATKR